MDKPNQKTPSLYKVEAAAYTLMRKKLQPSLHRETNATVEWLVDKQELKGSFLGSQGLGISQRVDAPRVEARRGCYPWS